MLVHRVLPGLEARGRDGIGDAEVAGAQDDLRHERRGAERAVAEGASYIAFGRFFNSNTKPGAPAATLELLDEARTRFAQPIVAIGGVTLDNAPGLIARGASLVAVIHALFAADCATEVEDRARAFAALFD